jgi:hypothetical protein
MNSVRVPNVNIRVNTGNLQARLRNQTRAIKKALEAKQQLFTRKKRLQEYLQTQSKNINSMNANNSVKEAREIISILKSFLYLKENLNSARLNALFTSLKRRIDILENHLKKRVPNRPRSNNGTPRPHTNNRQ